MMTDPRLHYLEPLARTPFHDRTSRLNRLDSWAPWAGYTTALAFDDVTMEYTAIRNAASVYDLTPMRKYRVTGAGAVAYVNRLTVRDASKLDVGHVHYTAWCDEHGKLIDDGTLFRQGDASFLLCCQEAHLPWLRDSTIGFDVEVSDATQDIAALAVQGPCSCAVLKKAGFTGVESLKPFRMAAFPFGTGGAKVSISRTGFTGDLGYELWTTPAEALALWDRLFEAGALQGICAVGTSALNMARIEAGFIITNMDFVAAGQAVRNDRARSPYEMGLEWMLDFGKGHFNGRRALLDEKRRGSKWALVGLDIEGNVSAEGALVYHNKSREVGHITAALWSPAAKRNIALATLERPYHAEKSDNLWVEIYALRELAYHKLMVRARVTERPFFNPPRRRATPPADF